MFHAIYNWSGNKHGEHADALLRFGADILLTLLALFLASLVRPYLPFGMPLTPDFTRLPWIIYALVATVWGIGFLLLSVYAPRSLRPVEEAQLIFAAVTVSTLTLGGILYFSFREISRLQILTFYGLDLVLLVGYRMAVRLILKLRNQPPYPRRKVLIVEAGEAGRDVLRMVQRYQWSGLEPVGFLDNALSPQTQIEGVPVLGKVEEVAQYVESEGIDEVVVALPLRAYDQLLRLIADLQNLAVRVRILPDYFKTTLFRTKVDDFAGMPMITLRQPTLDPFERQVKRAFDLAVGSFLFALSLPLMALIALAIRLDSPGPVLFSQQRVGESGQLFWMHKFRSMVLGAEDQEGDMTVAFRGLELLNKQPDDPRVTAVGRFLRRTSLDELPQLINVLKGEMSLVGPRPELPWLVEQYEPWQWQRFAVPQGITGWWQVNGRNDQPMYLHSEEDLFYIQHYSLLLDIQILWRTIGAVLKGRGAY
jgi:exopolysaccharide biosynthesis polyprenyl glycosylphosphotransferase